MTHTLLTFVGMINMKWLNSRIGTERVVKQFLLLPKMLYRNNMSYAPEEYRWLCFALVRQSFSEVWGWIDMWWED